MANREEQLLRMTAKQLRDVAKELNIPGRWDMTKQQMIEAILKVEKSENEKPAETDSAKEEQKIEESAKSEEQVNNEKETAPTPTALQQLTEERRERIGKAEVGSIVAFFDGRRIRSAAIKNRNSKKQLLKLETKEGQEFIVSYNDVAWVKTSKRWPRGIYNLLTGGVEAYERAMSEKR